MEQAIKQQWAEALRSGKYPQGTSKLFRPSNGTYCCLGVLGCINGLTLDGNGNTFTESHKVPSNSGVTYPQLFDRFGLDEIQQELFYRMNDGEKKTFAEIADFIENEFEK